MKTEIKEIKKAQGLPEEWNGLAEDYFQKREFLLHAEKYNPCLQKYYALYQDGLFRGGAVAYTLQLDLLTYLGLPSALRMRIIGIPCSVSSSGIFGDEQAYLQLIGYMQKKERGLLLFLNLNSIPGSLSMISGRTFPTIILENRFNSWQEYSNSLKSCYRRRMKNILNLFTGIEIKRSHCSYFSKQMHHFYLQVHERSQGKLEKLSLSFFQNLPPPFQLTAYYYDNTLLGWYISAFDNKKFYFFMAGYDYQKNERFNTYFNLLLDILKEGITRGAAYIDFGQTAEIPKTRLGGQVIEKKMAGYHSCWLLRKLLQGGEKFLEYSRTIPSTNVFKRMVV